MQGKNYQYYSEVIRLIKPLLSARSIEIVQIGGKEDAPLDGCHHVVGKYNLNQGSYLLRNALLHLGNDSVWGHRAGYLGIPLVQVYGPTDPSNHASYEARPERSVFLESHRWNRQPTFASQEHPSTIALIKPEDVASAVLRLLDIPHEPFPQTQLIGANYLQSIIEVVPNASPTIQGAPDFPYVVRMDYEHNEAGLQAILQTGRRIHLFTKVPINLNLLATFKATILSYNHEIDDKCPLDYVKIIGRLFAARSFFSRTEDAAELARLRFHFFDVAAIDHLTYHTKTQYLEESARYLNIDVKKALDIAPNPAILRFRTNKYLLSHNKVYLSYAHLLADISTPAIGANEAAVIDTPEFWRETNHQMIYL